VAHLVGQRLLNTQGVAEPFFRLNHAQHDRRKSRQVAHGARMTAIEMSCLFSDDPQSAERRLTLALQRHQQELRYRESATLYPAEGASRLSHQDRSADIHANTGRTVFAWHRHTLHRCQRSLHAKPAKAVDFRIKNADTG